MVTVVYCTRETKPEFKEHLIKSSGLDKRIEVIEIINNGESLTKAYNRGLNQASNDIVLFCHDDLTVNTKQWGTKLIKHFKKHSEYGIIGIAGSKSLPESGQWWADRTKMYGRVEHTNEGKTWLSSYSNDIGQNIEETIILDGLFFAIHKDRIKTKFDESVEGFHFYDISFCFDNYLKGVKIGVITNIRINHQSIGQTNQAWEDNRLSFAEKNKENLPTSIKKDFKNEKMQVLIGCLSFQGLTGSELYVFELAKQLTKQGCEVSVCSNIGNPLQSIAKRLGIKTFTIQEPPGFKLGDGKWSLNTPDGPQISVENTLYKVAETSFDIIHLNHKPVTEHLLKLYPDVPAICSIHSEVIALEEPVLSPQIKKYVAIRPEIKEHIVNKFSVNEDLVDVIYNPIDTDRFKVKNINKKKDKKRILFVGTIDYLRKSMLEDLIVTTRENDQELWLVGKNNDSYLDAMLAGHSHVTYHPPSNSVEDYIHQCDETAGILLGRTTIEGWLCGKKGWIYDIDDGGNILSKALHDIPEDVDKFKGKDVVSKIIEEYKEILN